MLEDKLMKLRKKQGYSQQEVADILDVSRQTISNWECGQGSPALDKAKELADLYRVHIDDLVSDDIDVITSEESPKLQKDLHLLPYLNGKTCKIDSTNLDWMTYGGDKKVKVLEANNDWVKIEYQRSDGITFFGKENVIQLLDADTINAFVIWED